MNKTKIPSNNIKALCKEKKISARKLAEKIGTSEPHMSRLIRRHTPLSIKWLLKISGALKVPTSKIMNVDIDQKLIKNADDTLLGSIMGWLLEASDDYKIALNRQELTTLTSFIYKEAIEQPLNFGATRYLSFAAVQVKSLLNK